MKLEFYAADQNSLNMELSYSGPDTGGVMQIIPSNAVWQRDPHTSPVISIDPLVTYVVQNDNGDFGAGVTCHDASGTVLTSSITYTPGDTSVITLAGASPNTVTYTCIDSLGFTSTGVRSFYVRGLPTITLNGPAEVRLRLGTPYVEIGACCLDSDNNAVSMVTPDASSVNVNTAGQYPLVWLCTDTYTGRSASGQRTVIVDSPPSILLLGDSTTVSTKGTGYFDAGALCTDPEDGQILQNQGDVDDEQIPILSIEVFPGGAVGDSHQAIDGQDSVSTCASDCFKFKDKIVFDLGRTRTIHEVRIYSSGTATLDSIRVIPQKFFDPTGNDWNHKCAGSTTLSGPGWNTIVCEPRLAGSAVGLYRGSVPSDEVPLCELQVWGTLGPPAPKSFNVSGGCPTLEGSYYISGTQDSLPEYKGVSQGGTGLGVLRFSQADQKWIFKEFSSDLVYAEAVSAGSLPEIVWQAAGSGVASNCVPEIDFVPEEACTWLFGPGGSVDGEYRCADGTMVTGSDVCEPHGGLAFCPPNLSVMCQTSTAVGAYNQYTCQATNAACPTTGDPYDGRRCQDSVQAGTCTPSPTTSCLASLQIVNTVPGASDQEAKDYVMHFACIDSLGQGVSVDRTVSVGCEGPNPVGFFGGNQIDCDTQMNALSLNATSSAECAGHCLADTLCEAFEFDTAALTCWKWKSCRGVYSQDLVFTREVGYCQRVDHPPSVVLDDAGCCVNVNNVWPEPSYGCEDAEDAFEPAMTRVSNLDESTPGNYIISYTCTDLAGQTDTKIRNVTVKADCAVPTTVANSDTSCQYADGSGTITETEIPHGQICTTHCNGQLNASASSTGRYFPDRLTISCVTTDDMDFNSNWDTLFVCGPFPCNSPTVDHVITHSCQEGALFTGQCTPNCECNRNYGGVTGVCGWPSYIPMPVNSFTVQGQMICTNGVLSPLTFRCMLPAEAPATVVLDDPGYLDIIIRWTAGSDPGDCTFSHFWLQGALEDDDPSMGMGLG
jgi:hypothetical protein